MCSGILPEMFAKTAPTSSLLPVPSCQQRRRRRCPHSPMLADPRSALRRRLFFFLYLARGLALRASLPASQAVRSLSAREKQMPPSASLVFLSLSRSRTRAPRFLACFAGRPLAIRTRKTNAAFGVACFSFVLDTLYPRWLLTSTKLLVQYRKFC